MQITIGSDHRGRRLRTQIVESLRRLGYAVEQAEDDASDQVDYPDIAALVASRVSTGEADRGLLIGGTGSGMCVVANKFPGVRAAPCHDELAAEMSRRHNDLNVLCLSAELLSDSTTQRIVEVWLKTPFEGGRHARRIEKITAIEQRHRWMLIKQSQASYKRNRSLLACEIHDGLAQKLAGVLMQLQAIKSAQQPPQGTLQTAIQILQDSINEVRRLMTGLRPPILDEAGLVAAIESVIRNIQQQDGPMIEFAANGQIERMSALLETGVFRIVQESLANACRYSQSEKIRIAIEKVEQDIHVEIQDWGIGFDPSQVEAHCFGLRGIQERARLLGGRAVIDSEPGKGTRITVALPLLDTTPTWVVGCQQ